MLIFTKKAIQNHELENISFYRQIKAVVISQISIVFVFHCEIELFVLGSFCLPWSLAQIFNRNEWFVQNMKRSLTSLICFGVNFSIILIVLLIILGFTELIVSHDLWHHSSWNEELLRLWKSLLCFKGTFDGFEKASTRWLLSYFFIKDGWI